MTRKQKIVGFMNEKSYVPMTLEDLAAVLEVPRGDVGKLEALLDELIGEGLVVQTKKKRYAIIERLGLVRGLFQGNERGFGFVLTEADQADVFIPADSTHGALNGDMVLAKIVKADSGGKRREGEITKITERANQTVVGLFEKSRNHGFVVPDDKRIAKDIYIPKEDCLNARDGQKVVALVTEFPETRRNPEGRIVEVLGYPSENDTVIRSVLRQYHIRDTFDEGVLGEAERIPSVISEQETEGRMDFRGECVITIDGEDAKDLDDAISLQKMEGGHYRLGVHIADVSHYVKQNGKIDKEAYERGTSVYLVDRVVPMLPERLSNGICSLHPHEDRLTVSAVMEVDKGGKVVDYKIGRSVIRSSERMTYQAVTEVLEQSNPETCQKYAPLRGLFEDMRELALVLRRKRTARGSLDFDFPEAKIKLDEDGKPLSIEKYETTISNQIIEEFMLLANETVAEHVFWMGKPCMYRVHEKPDAAKIETFAKIAHNLGYPIKASTELHPKTLQKVLEKCKGKKEEKVLSTMMLRSLMKAEYSPENLGHFGLSAKYYCHFTSPIRRYPDLTVHRIVKELERAGMDGKRESFWAEYVKKAAVQCSETERAAESAERDVDDIKKVEYMHQFIGETFTGVVSGVTSFGFFVELDNTVEGLVRVTSLDDDYYIFHEDQMMLLGEHTHKMYRIGDEVTVRLVDAKPEVRQIDFIVE